MPSALSARGAESSRPWRPQPLSCPRPREQHLCSGPLPLGLASTFGPAQYNPAAAPRGRGLGTDGREVGARGGLGGCGSQAGAHQVGAKRRRGPKVT